jgi:hypothetical protein
VGDKLWKAFERFVGKEIFDGARRNMGSGAVNKDDNGNDRSGDIIHPIYQVECKVYKNIAVFRWWEKLKKEAHESKKIPILVMREKGNAKDVLVTLHYKDFIEMKSAWEGKSSEK